MVKKVLILDTPGCATCKSAEELIDLIKKEEKLQFQVEVIDITVNPEMHEKYPVMSAPGIVIDGKLFSEGKPFEEKLREALRK